MAQSTDDTLPDQINMIGEGTLFEGTLRADSNVRVSGHIKGKLDIEGRAIVTQEGVVEGELHATDADVAGSVQGEIHVSERLMLKSTARVDGNIESGRIKVEEGALFSGQCNIGEQVSEKVQEQISQKGPSSSRSSSSSGTSSSPTSSSSGETTGTGKTTSGGTSKSDGTDKSPAKKSSSGGNAKKATSKSKK